MTKVAVGIIGFGEWVKSAYLPALEGTEGAVVVAVAARSEAGRAAAGERLGERVALYADYRDLLADPAVGAVMIAVPNRVHSEVLIAAARAGKALFFEPPLGLGDEEAQAALAALEACDGPVQADFELRYTPVLRRVVAMVQDGSIGAPLMARVRLWCNWGHGGGEWKEEVQGQGFFPWLGYWYLDVLDAVFGAAPLSACVVGGRAMNGDLTDHGWAALTYPDGRLGQLEFSLIAAETQHVGVLVAGTGGEVEADLWSGDLRRRVPGGDWELASVPCAQPICGFSGMRESVGRFVAAAGAGLPVPANMAVIRRVHAAAWGCARSDATGENVTID